MSTDFCFKEFETSRLKLVLYKESFIRDAYEIYNDTETMRMAGPSRHLKIEETQEFIQSAIKSSLDGSFLFWAILDKKNGKMIGDISMHPDYKHKYALIGSILNKKYFQQGLMTEATWPVLDYMFYELEFNRIEGQMCTEHVASIKYMEKLGCINEGRIRQNFFIDGKLYDSFMYAVLKNEYKSPCL